MKGSTSSPIKPTSPAVGDAPDLETYHDLLTAEPDVGEGRPIVPENVGFTFTSCQ
jgi:hypothetical protein